MNKFTIEKEITFEAGHRLCDYEGKCKYVHGHNYIVKVGLQATFLDNGFVVDFAKIKIAFKNYIDKHIDHGMILCKEDTQWIKIMKRMKQKIYIIDDNPTAENIAKNLYENIGKRFDEILYITIEETPTSRATYAK